MEPLKMAKQMIDFQKATFDNTFNAMVLVQEQMERTTGMFLDQAAWLPAEGKKVIEEWVKACKKGRENFKSAVDDGFKKVEAFFDPAKD